MKHGINCSPTWDHPKKDVHNPPAPLVHICRPPLFGYPQFLGYFDTVIKVTNS